MTELQLSLVILIHRRLNFFLFSSTSESRSHVIVDINIVSPLISPPLPHLICHLHLLGELICSGPWVCGKLRIVQKKILDETAKRLGVPCSRHVSVDVDLGFLTIMPATSPPSDLFTASVLAQVLATPIEALATIIRGIMFKTPISLTKEDV